MDGVLLVEDHALLAQALGLALGARGLLAEVVPLQQLGDLRAVLAYCVERGPAAVLLDLDLDPHGDAGVLVAPLASAGCRVLVVTGADDDSRQAQCLLDGALGVLPKSTPLDALVTATTALAVGGEVVPQAERDRVLAAGRRARSARQEDLAPFHALTPRESEVLGALVDGVAATAIADRFVVAEATVRAQIRSVLRKLQVSSQLQAVALAHRARWPGPQADRRQA